MRNILVFAFVFGVIAVLWVRAAPAPNSANPQIDTIRRGLIQKLCDNAHGTSRIQRTATPSSSTVEPGDTMSASSEAPKIPPRRTIPPGSLSPPTCNEFNSLSLEQLIERNKALLKPVVRNPSRSFA